MKFFVIALAMLLFGSGCINGKGSALNVVTDNGKTAMSENEMIAMKEVFAREGWMPIETSKWHISDKGETILVIREHTPGACRYLTIKDGIVVEYRKGK